MVTDVEISLWYNFLYHLLEHWLIIEDQVKTLWYYLKEVYIFQALKQLPREKIQIATKFGIQTLAFPNVKVNGSPEYVRSSCEASLKRLDVEYIDLYYQHRVDTKVPIEETVSDSHALSITSL